MKLTQMTKCKPCDGTGQIETVMPEELRKAREQAGISLREMARTIGISGPYLSDIELGHRNCPNKVREAYAALEAKP